MRYNFKRLNGIDWYNTIALLRARGLRFLEVKNSSILYDKYEVTNPWTVYYYRTISGCKIVYYNKVKSKFKKCFNEISFSKRTADPVRCVIEFRKIAKGFNELLPFEPDKVFTNGVYTYFKGKYKGYSTALDMNSAYLYALKQPLPDWETRTECTFDDVYKQKYDFYCFENPLHCEMFYRKDYARMLAAHHWSDLKIYGYKASVHYEKTCNELYRLKKEVNKERYKNVANVAIGCMHKRSGEQNNSTLAAGLYAWFAWYIDFLVDCFEKKGYHVIMITTDSIKIKGKYNQEDNIVKIGTGLGEFKVEFEGESEYISEGHYRQANDTKWKGKPLYQLEGYPICKFIENIEEELPIYEKYSVT